MGSSMCSVDINKSEFTGVYNIGHNFIKHRQKHFITGIIDTSSPYKYAVTFSYYFNP